MTQLRLEVEGLRELRLALRDLEDPEATREFRLGLRAAAEEVSDEAKLRANAFSFQAADTIRPGTSGTRAHVTGGRRQLSWYGWADFGSRNARTGQSRSVGPWANSGPGPRGGRFIYPAIDAKWDSIIERMGDAVTRAARRLGFDTDRN